MNSKGLTGHRNCFLWNHGIWIHRYSQDYHNFPGSAMFPASHNFLCNEISNQDDTSTWCSSLCESVRLLTHGESSLPCIWEQKIPGDSCSYHNALSSGAQSLWQRKINHFPPKVCSWSPISFQTQAPRPDRIWNRFVKNQNLCHSLYQSHEVFVLSGVLIKQANLLYRHAGIVR